MLLLEQFQTTVGTVLLAFADPTVYQNGEIPKRTYERQLVNGMLQQYLQDRSIEVSHHANGQPFLHSRPQLHLSISHSTGWFAIYLSEQEMVGIDVQTHISSFARKTDYFINEHEQAHYGSFADEQLYAIWCGKEAFYKRLGGAVADLKNAVCIFDFPEENGFLSASYDVQQFRLRLLQDSEKTLVILPA